MPENDKEIKSVEKQNNNESLADSKKIDLYINNNNDEMEQGISIMNVFGRLKQRFHIYVYIILLGLIAGLLVPVMMYTFKDKKDAGISILGLDYEGAEQGLAPDGTPLDISQIKSSYIVQNALSSVNLTKKVSVAQVQGNLTIAGVLTDETRQQLDILNKLAADKSSEYAKLIQEFKLKYRAQYIITIDSVFTAGGSKKLTLPASDLSNLLYALTDAYAAYFVDTYQDKSLPSNYLGAIDVNTLDYLDILDEVSSSLNYLEKYCQAKATTYSNFRNSDGLSFGDLSSTIATVKTVDIDYIYSFIYLNNVSKDASLQLTKYKYQKREASLDLAEVNERINTLQSSIDAYVPDKIVISTEGGEQKTIDRTSDYYNQLVMNLTAANEQKSSLEEQISMLDYRIEKLEGPEATAEDKAKAQAYIDEALENATQIYDLVNNSSYQLFNSNSYNNRYMHAVVTSESEKLSDNLKSFGIGAAVGLIIGIVLWIGDAFILEFRSSHKNEELKEAK